MHSQWNKNRSVKKSTEKGPRSYSEPALAKRIPLPPVARSDIRRRRVNTDPRSSSLEPWHSSRVVRHSYVPSLASLRVPGGYNETTHEYKKPSISLRGAELSNPPKNVFGMTDLESLVLSPDKESCIQFRLDAVPKEVGNLRNLRQLVLDTNDLQEVPEQLGELKHLDTLTLSNNHLATLPEGFSKLSNLQSLHLANNRFTEIPADICCLESLSFLDMSDNSIREIPDEIDQLAPTLTMLFLYINDLEQLPDSFCNLTELTTLWLGQNRLTSLPENFGDLTNLDWAEFPSETNIDDNPMKTPPLAVCRKGVDAIRKFFARKQR